MGSPPPPGEVPDRRLRRSAEEYVELVAPADGGSKAETVDLVEALGAETLVYVTTRWGNDRLAPPRRSSLVAGEGRRQIDLTARFFDAKGPRRHRQVTEAGRATGPAVFPDFPLT